MGTRVQSLVAFSYNAGGTKNFAILTICHAPSNAVFIIILFPPSAATRYTKKSILKTSRF
jgi:hypothetical protein